MRWCNCLTITATIVVLAAGVTRAQNTNEPTAPKRAETSLRLGHVEDQPAPEEPDGEDAVSEPGFWIFNRPSHVGSMSSDRPGFSDSYSVVPRGYSHLESGYSFYYDKEGSSRTRNHTLGEFSLRTGLLDNLELRIKWTGYSFTESRFSDTSRWAGRHITVEDHDDGGTDMSLGFKTQLLKQNGWVPNLPSSRQSRYPRAPARNPRATRTPKFAWRGTTRSARDSPSTESRSPRESATTSTASSNPAHHTRAITSSRQDRGLRGVLRAVP